MKKINILLLLIFLIPISFVNGQDIISAQELAKIIKKDNVVLVSARTASDYKKVHITGAVHINHTDLYNEVPVKNMLKNPGEIATILGSKGISESKTIVLYDDGTGKYSGRLYWILSYLGAKDVKILDGHMDAWKAARKPVTKNPTKIKPATFTAKVDKAKIATMAQVKAANGSASSVIVDARAPEEYKGAATTELRKGHIPGAVNIEFKNMMDAKGKLKSVAELQKIFDAAGVTKDKEVILYCESGVRAGIIYFTLCSALNYTKVKVYDGAYLEWQAASANKVEV
ncbi:MAG: sulfurtransferase [Cyclobacteriaceae bacterium]|nr:sulfurtransferase [Cyclobacteriaceae bacterium]MCK5280211.1 sulfurtransferase [Cyclobacteriaceae bacterium]MCK5467352.1 sulfurtransferase [Cyclobacteriaceae bacterium]